MKRYFKYYKQTELIVLIIIMIMLAGCATSEKSPLSEDSVPAFSKSEKREDNSNKNTTHKINDKIPAEKVTHKEDIGQAEQDTTISPEAFYYMLSGEIAGQRNRIKLSADSYVRAAKLTRSPKIAARAAQIAMYAKDYKTAMQAASVWTDSEPDNVAARKLVAGLQLKQGRIEKAINNYAHVLSTPEVDFEKSAVQIADSIAANTSEPYPVIESLIERFPGTAELPFAYAFLAIRQKDFKTAEYNLDKTLAIRPDWDAALLMKTKLVAQSGDTQKAMKMLDKATRQFPDNAEIHALYAKLLAMQHNYSKAVNHFQRVVDLDPANADAGFALAIMQSTLGDFDSARDGLLELAKNPKHRQRAYLQLGQLSAENKLYDEALAWLDQVESSPLAYDAQIYASEILVEQKDYQGALSRLRRLRNQYPQLSARIALRQADVYSKNKQLEQSIEVLTSAIATNPTNKQLLYMRSLLADQNGDYQLAETDLLALLEIEPENVNALNALGYILCNRTERLEEAEKYLKRAIKLKPNDPAIMDSMGWLRYQQANFQEALKYLQSAYQKNHDVEIGVHLAEVLWSDNRHDEARAVLQEAWNKNSSHESLLKMKQRLPAAFIGIVSN